MRAVGLHERWIDGQPVQREACLCLGRVGGRLLGVQTPAALRARVRHVSQQPGLLAVGEAHRFGAPERLYLTGAGVEEGPERGDMLAHAREQEGGVGTARSAGGDVVVVDGRAELVGEHAHERVDRDGPRLAAGHRDVRRRAKAVAVRRREVAHTGEDGGALVGEGQHRDELVALLRELRHAGDRHRAPLAAFTRVAIE